MQHIQSPSLLRRTLAAAVVALFASGCTDSGELEALQASTASTIEQLEGDLADRDETITDLRAELADAGERLEQAETDLESIADAMAEVEAERDAALDEAAETAAENQELRNTYDAEIRADAQAAWDAELVRACAAAGEGAAAFDRYPNHDDQLAIIGSEAELVEAVAACAQPLRDRSEEERLADECSTGDPDALTRGTSSFVGDCLVVYAIPFQWDSRTGACNFLGHWDGTNNGTRSYRYDGDGLFRAGVEVCADDLDGADQDDVLKLWVEVLGTYTYDTAAGGTNAVPEFEIVRAELITKA